MQLRSIDGWKEKIVKWIREENVDGKKIVQTSDKELTVGIRKKLVPDTDSRFKEFKRLNGPSKKLLRICKSLPVHNVLQKAKAKGMTSFIKTAAPFEVLCIILHLH